MWCACASLHVHDARVHVCSLSLQGARIKDAAVEALVYSKGWHSIERLNVKGTGITDAGRSALTAAIKTEQCKLQYLVEDKFAIEPDTTRLDCQNRGLNDCNVGLLVAVMQASAFNAPLSHLDLRGNPGITTQGGKVLVAAFKQSKTIEVVCGIPVREWLTGKMTRLKLFNKGLDNCSATILSEMLLLPESAPLQSLE